MTGIAFDVDMTETLEDIEAVQSALSPVSIAAFMETTSDAIVKMRIAARFKSQGDDATGPWLPLKASTKTFRKLSGFAADGPINVRTGELLDWLMNVDPFVEVTNWGDTQATWPADQPDGWILRKFSTAQKGRGNTPPRPVLRVSEVDLRLHEQALAAYITHLTGLNWS